MAIVHHRIQLRGNRPLLDTYYPPKYLIGNYTASWHTLLMVLGLPRITICFPVHGGTVRYLHYSRLFLATFSEAISYMTSIPSTLRLAYRVLIPQCTSRIPPDISYTSVSRDW
jgi:hypothetical protein